jgi:hypothetical protein
MSTTDLTSAWRAAFARTASRLVLAAALSTLIAGCGGKHGVVTPSAGTTVGLPTADQQALDGAASWFADHRAGGVASARRALVDSLAHGWAGVARAELARDSTTIVIGFADGFTGALNTNPALAAGSAYDPTAMRNALNGTQPLHVERAARVNLPASAHVTARADLSARRPAPFSIRGRTTARDIALFQAPQSRKVLLIDSSNGSLSADANTPLLDYIKAFLVNHHGYSASDIVIRTNLLADNYGSLNFEDFLRVKDYGLIVILARSIVWDAPNNPDDWSSVRENHYFIEVAERVGYNARHQPGGGGGAERFDVQAEIRKGRVIPTSELNTSPNAPTYLYMRDDLWSEQLDGDFPGSVVLLISPHGDIATSVFALHQARSLSTWTDSLGTQPAADGLWMPLFMAQGNVSDVEAADNGYVPAHYGASDFTVWPGGRTKVYLPTWADVSTASAPTGTQTVRVNVTYASGDVMLPEASVLEDLPSAVKNFRSMVPAQSVRFLAQALSSSGTVLGEVHVDTLLRTGRNNVALTFPLAASGLSLEAGATSVDATSPANVTLVAAVRDGQGNPIAGRQVQFSQVPAAGTFVGANPATTNASGLATIVVHTEAFVVGVDAVRVSMIARDLTSSKADTMAVDYCKSTRYSVWLSGTGDVATFNTTPAGTFSVSGVALLRIVNGDGPYGIATMAGPTHAPFALSSLYTSGDHLQFVVRPTAAGMSASIGPLYVHVLNCLSHHVYGGGTIGVAPNTEGTLDVTIP